MPLILLNALRILWPYLLGAALLVFAHHKAETWCNAACVSATARAEKAESTLADAEKREAGIALLWSANVQKAESETHNVLASQASAFSRIANNARSLPTLPSIHLSPNTWSVLNDASNLANAAGPTAQHQDAPAALSESQLGQKWSDAAAAYAEARTKWQACVNLYESFQHGQSESSTAIGP